jgi:hypothetical protein
VKQLKRKQNKPRRVEKVDHYFSNPAKPAHDNDIKLPCKRHQRIELFAKLRASNGCVLVSITHTARNIPVVKQIAIIWGNESPLVPSLENLTTIVFIKLIVTVSMEMSRWPGVLQSYLYVLLFDWPNLRQLCNFRKTFSVMTFKMS